MRIITANNYYYLRGGSERVLFDEEDYLRASGHSVFPFSTRHELNRFSATSAFFVPMNRWSTGLDLSRLASLPAVFHNVKAGRAFRTLLAHSHADLVHAHNVYGSLTTAVLFEAKRMGVPAVMTAHDTKLVCPTYLCVDHGRVCEACAGRHFYRAAIHRCHRQGALASLIFAGESYFNRWLGRYDLLTRIVTPSKFLRGLFIRNGMAADRLSYLPNGVDVASILPSLKEGKYALYVGRLSPEKGVATLVRAACGLDVPLRIAGDGPLRAELQRLAGGGATNIRFEGYCGPAELQTLFREASFVVLPSECYENAPLSILEAYAFGKPVLGARIGGISELIVPGESGELFEPGDVEQLRASLLSFWQQRGRLVEYGRAARQMAEEKYSLTLHGDRLLSLYRECLH